MNRLAAAYRADLLYAVERAKQGNCAPCWQDYCMEELAAAKDTSAYPQDGDALRAELQRLTAAVPQITNREAEAAELAAYGGKLLFYLDRDRGTLVELAYLPAPGRYSACAYIDAQASRARPPGPTPAASPRSLTNGGRSRGFPLINPLCPPTPPTVTAASLTRWRRHWATCTPACTALTASCAEKPRRRKTGTVLRRRGCYFMGNMQ